jgi:catechol 2,3-dioxygenase-like lactoylglutathione lyase family enzyme
VLCSLSYLAGPAITLSSVQFTKLTPNLLVANVERSVTFYVDVLGFLPGQTVPEQPPFVFASVVNGSVEIFFNEKETAVKEYPVLGGKPIGATGTMFIQMERGIEALHEKLRLVVPIVMPFVTQWYGVKEFAIADPDGYLITFAGCVAVDRASA